MSKKGYLLVILLISLLMPQINFTSADSPKTITAKIEYKPGSVWDSNDDGIESDKAAIDFTVENTKFSWNADEDKLCTKWEISALDGEKATPICYGNNKCCNFINLPSTSYKWNDVLYLRYNEYGASKNNKISARVIYVDYDLYSEKPYSSIYYSEWDYLYAVFLDGDYFRDAVAKDSTSDKEYIKTLSSFEKIKEKGNVDKILLTDLKDNRLERNLKDKNLRMKFYVKDENRNMVVSIDNFKDEDLKWDSLETLSFNTEDKVNEHMKNLDLIPRMSIALDGIKNILEEGKYEGIVEFDAAGVLYDGVMYCSDDDKCSFVAKCNNEDRNCYREEGSKVMVFVPHFSSVILVLNSSAVGLEITSPDNSSPILSGEGVYLNFTTNITVTAGYLFDADSYASLGSGNSFLSKLNGSLEFGVVKNGEHNLTIYIMDNESNFTNYSYSFIVNDAVAPDVNVSTNGMELNNLIIKGSDYNEAISVLSNEYGNIRYKLNNEEYQNVNLREWKLANVSLVLKEGANNITINASDLQGNSKIGFYGFNFTLLPSCSDGIQNGNESGVDCGDSNSTCSPCLAFNVTTNKPVYDPTERVDVTVVARANSIVNMTVTRENIVTYTYIFTPVFVGAPIATTAAIGNTANPGNYTINATMYYGGYRESKILYFYVNNTSGNPLSASINANATTINEGGTVGFGATITGNTSSVTYNWNFGDGGSSTEKNPAHAYNINGTYNVNLTVSSGQWVKSDLETITVRKLFNVTILVKNESNLPIENAKVEFNNIEGNTTIEGKAFFLVNSGNYRLTVSKESYALFTNTTDISANTTIEVRLSYYWYDNEMPIIQLFRPLDNDSVMQGDISIAYRVLDSSSANCTLYISADGGWWIEKAHERDITTDDERSFIINDLESKQYQWKIECIDKFGNSQISETNTFFVNSTFASEEDASIDQIITDIDNVISNLAYLDKNEKEAAIALELEKQLETAKRDLQRAKRDLNNLVWRRLNESGLDELRKTILDKITDIKRTTPKTIKVVESKEFINYPSREDVENISFTLLEHDDKKYKRKEKEDYAAYNQELQNLIKITTKTKILEVEYISGETGDITLVEKEVKKEKNLTGTNLIEAIPKTIAANTSFINAKFDYAVVVEDPVIRFDIPAERYVYYFNNKIDLDGIKEIKSIIASEDIIEKNPIIGFAIFGDITSKLIQSSNIRLIIEIIIIVLLMIVYLGFTTGFKKVKYLVKDRSVIRNAKEISQSVENAFSELHNNQYEKAKTIYKNINQTFKQLPADMRKEAYDKVVLLSNRLDVFHINRLIDKAEYSLENNQMESASLIYKQINQIYKNISPKFKLNVLKRCGELHKKLNEKVAA